MLKKELLDTAKALAATLLTFLATLFFVSIFLQTGSAAAISFADLAEPAIFIFLCFASFYYGSMIFAEEKNHGSFEYLFSFPYRRYKLLAIKILPRLSAMVLLFLFALLVLSAAGNELAPYFPLFIVISLDIFLFSIALSLLHKYNFLNLVYNFVLFFAVSGVFLAIVLAFDFSVIRIRSFAFMWSTIEKLGLVGALFATLFFILFLSRFKKMDIGNLFTLSRGIVLKSLLVMVTLFLLYVLFNQVDTGSFKPVFSENNLEPAGFDEGNGFYRLYSLHEPPEVDVESPGIIQKYRKYQDPALRTREYLQTYRPYEFVTDRKKFFNPLMRSPFFDFPWNSTSRWNEYVLVNKEQIRRLQDEMAVYLERFRRLVNSPVVADFMLPRHDSPIPNLWVFEKTSELYIGSEMLDALEGNWETTASNLLAHIAFCKKVIRGSRSIPVNQSAKTTMGYSLVALANLMNHPGCPARVYDLVSEGLPAPDYREYGTHQAFDAEYSEFSDYLEAGGDRSGFRKFLLGLLTQKNRTLKYYHDFLVDMAELDRTPPYQWEQGLKELSTLYDRPGRGWSWWLQNPGGKALVQVSSFFDVFHTLSETFRVKTLYDMTRIAAVFHRRCDPGKTVEENLAILEIYHTLTDPCSGKPYRYHPKKKVLYSPGSDRVDDSGKHHWISWEMDFALPLVLNKIN